MKIELSHDILAQKVYERVSLEDKRLREVERLVRERYAFYQGEPKLGKEEVDFVRPYLAKVDLSAEERRFVKDSRRRIAAKRRRRLLTIAAFILAIIGGLSFYAISVTRLNDQIKEEKAEAIAARAQAEAERAKADSARKVAIAARDTAELAQQEAMTQRDRAEKNADIAERRAKRIREDAKVLRTQATRLEKQADSLSQLTTDLTVANRIAEEKRRAADSLKQIAERKARAANLLTAQSLANQSLKIRDNDSPSLRLKRLLAREAYRIHEEFRTDSTGREWASPYDPQIYNALYDALTIAADTFNRVKLPFANRQRFQVRAIDRQKPYLFALTSGGNLIQWTWHDASQSLREEKLLVKGERDDIYFTQAIAGEELASLGPMRGLRRYDRNSADEGLQSMQSENTEADLIIPGPWRSDLLIGQHRAEGGTVFFFRREPEAAVRLSPTLVDAVIAEDGRWMAARDRAGRLYGYRVRLTDTLRIDSLALISPDRYSTLAFRPGSSELAAGREDGNAERYVFLEGGKGEAMGTIDLIETLRGHSARISSLNFDDSGRFLATGSFDGVIQVWDLQDDKHQRFGPLAINVPGGLLQSVCFVPEGEVLVSGDNQGSLRRWPIDAGYWYDQLVQKVPLDQMRFSDDEVNRYLGNKAEMESADLLMALPEYEK